MVASVAVFNQKASSTKVTDAPGKEGGNLFGAYSAGIWRAALEPILRDKTWNFPPEDPEVVNGDSVPVPPVVGLDVGAASALLAANGFQVKVSDERKDNDVPANFVAEQSPSGRGARGMTITLYLSSGKLPGGAARAAGSARSADPSAAAPGRRRGRLPSRDPADRSSTGRDPGRIAAPRSRRS